MNQERRKRAKETKTKEKRKKNERKFPKRKMEKKRKNDTEKILVLIFLCRKFNTFLWVEIEGEIEIIIRIFYIIFFIKGYLISATIVGNLIINKRCKNS